MCLLQPFSYSFFPRKGHFFKDLKKHVTKTQSLKSFCFSSQSHGESTQPSTLWRSWTCRRISSGRCPARWPLRRRRIAFFPWMHLTTRWSRWPPPSWWPDTLPASSIRRSYGSATKWGLYLLPRWCTSGRVRWSLSTCTDTKTRFTCRPDPTPSLAAGDARSFRRLGHCWLLCSREKRLWGLKGYERLYSQKFQ